MYLSNIKLWNFRKFGNADFFDIDKPNVDIPFKRGLQKLELQTMIFCMPKEFCNVHSIMNVVFI
jgi:hypothetical protein